MQSAESHRVVFPAVLLPMARLRTWQNYTQYFIRRIVSNEVAGSAQPAEFQQVPSSCGKLLLSAPLQTQSLCLRGCCPTSIKRTSQALFQNELFIRSNLPYSYTLTAASAC